jgi:hypothetical protein
LLRVYRFAEVLRTLLAQQDFGFSHSFDPKWKSTTLLRNARSRQPAEDCFNR